MSFWELSIQLSRCLGKFPLIVDIKKNSREDGPGIRSVVFFKGCPMRCIFCQNIETQETEAEIAFSAKECIGCRKCVNVCSQEAIDLKLPNRIYRDKCIRCGECANVCPGRGLRVVGTYYSVEELTKILIRDKAFYSNSGGGVTLSGGECTLYPDYLKQLLKNLKLNNIHTAIETSGYFDYDIFSEKILPYLDFIYYDVKIADLKAHKKYTGKGNQKIFDNLYRLLQESDVEIHPRIPLIPGITATRENLSAIVNILHSLGANDVSLLPYNPMGMGMAPKLGKSKPPLPEGFMKPDEEEKIHDIFRAIIEEIKKLDTVIPAPE